MSYLYSYAPRVQEELVDAAAYYLAVTPDKTFEDFLSLARESFRVLCEFPKVKQVIGLDEDGRKLRRVNVWHFVFLYRVDEPNRRLLVDRIYHERADG